MSTVLKSEQNNQEDEVREAADPVPYPDEILHLEEINRKLDDIQDLKDQLEQQKAEQDSQQKQLDQQQSEQEQKQQEARAHESAATSPQKIYGQGRAGGVLSAAVVHSEGKPRSSAAAVCIVDLGR